MKLHKTGTSWSEGERGQAYPPYLAFLLGLSLSLNVYFLFVKNAGVEPKLAEARVSAENVPLQEEKPSSKKKSLTKISSSGGNENTSDKYSVKEASFYSPDLFEGSEVKTLHFKVDKSLNYTICKVAPKGSCKLLSAYVARILVWHFDVNRSIRKGDTLDLVYKKDEKNNGFQILRMEYMSQYLNKKLIANHYKSVEVQEGSYFDENGSEVSTRIREGQAPIRNYQEITSLPGDFRRGILRGHSGTDFKADVGTPVFASFSGKVLRVNWNRRVNGYCIEIEHAKRKIKTLYLHLDRVLVRPGQRVKQSEKIAESGNTGRSYAPHLHYEIRQIKGKRVVNPFKSSIHQTYKRRVADFKKYVESVRLYESVLQESLS